MKTYDCEATLTDSQVLDFCRNGFLMLEGVVPDDVNRRSTEFCNEHPEMEPTAILNEDWFHENVTINPVAAGAIRSLLGKNFHLPVLMSNHRVECPAGETGGWHVDGNFDFQPKLDYLQVFYYPQETPPEMGPTAIVPGTHLVKNIARGMSHYGQIRNANPTASPAGSIFLTTYQIWHRRTPSTASGIRNNLKYFYWRTQPSCRDWVVEPDFDFATADYRSPAGGLVDQFRDCMRVAEMFCRLCGREDLYQNLGGQSWPLPADRLADPYGFPAELNQELNR